MAIARRVRKEVRRHLARARALATREMTRLAIRSITERARSSRRADHRNPEPRPLQTNSLSRKSLQRPRLRFLWLGPGTASTSTPSSAPWAGCSAGCCSASSATRTPPTTELPFGRLLLGGAAHRRRHRLLRRQRRGHPRPLLAALRPPGVLRRRARRARRRRRHAHRRMGQFQLVIGSARRDRPCCRCSAPCSPAAWAGCSWAWPSASARASRPGRSASSVTARSAAALGGFVGGVLFGWPLPVTRNDTGSRRLAVGRRRPGHPGGAASARCRPWCRASSSRPRSRCCAAGRRAASIRWTRRDNLLGRDEHADIALFRDMKVEKKHAFIQRERQSLRPGQQRCAAGVDARQRRAGARSAAICTTATAFSSATSCCASRAPAAKRRKFSRELLQSSAQERRRSSRLNQTTDAFRTPVPAASVPIPPTRSSATSTAWRCAAGRRSAAVGSLPHEFVFPSGRRCRTFDDLVQGCQYEWEDAPRLLRNGDFAQVPGQRRPHRPRPRRQGGADQPRPRHRPAHASSARLPAAQVQGPRLDLEPRRLILGTLIAGETAHRGADACPTAARDCSRASDRQRRRLAAAGGGRRRWRVRPENGSRTAGQTAHRHARLGARRLTAPN